MDYSKVGSYAKNLQSYSLPSLGSRSPSNEEEKANLSDMGWFARGTELFGDGTVSSPEFTLPMLHWSNIETCQI